MKYNLYDFDGTIYDGDSSFDFFKFCAKRDKRIKKIYLKIIISFLKHKAKYISSTEFKECIFSFLAFIDDIDTMVLEFWNSHEEKIKDFYLNKDKKNDIIISASPYFLLKPICDKLGVKDLIASDVNSKNGHFNSVNNRGEEKVKVFYKKYPKAIISEMYSDSMHDKPLLDLAQKSYMVKGNKIYDYRTYKPGVIKRIWNWGWKIYHKKEEVWNYLIVGGLTTVVSIVSYAICSKVIGIDYIISNIISWVLSVVFAYFTNKWLVFHTKGVSMFKEFIYFTGSRLLTLLLDTGLMILFVEVINMDDLLAKVIVQLFIIVANYIISKFIVFGKKSTNM